MSASEHIDAFLSGYPEKVQETAAAARRLLFTLIMSQTGMKLGIFRDAPLPDPRHLMAGAGKIHRHVQLRSPGDVERPGLKPLLKAALAAWRTRQT